MYRILVALLFATIFPYQALAQAAPRAEVFGGFQYFREGTGVGSVSDFNLNGWDASLSGYFNKYLGVTADFSGAYGSPEILGIPVHTKLHTFMFGPVLRLPNPTRLTPFFHALGGGARNSGSAVGLNLSETDAAWAVGGGVDAGKMDIEGAEGAGGGDTERITAAMDGAGDRAGGRFEAGILPAVHEGVGVNEEVRLRDRLGRHMRQQHR